MDTLRTESQRKTARKWLEAIDSEIHRLISSSKASKDLKQVLTLKEDQSIAWEKDEKWDEMMRVALAVLPKEPRSDQGTRMAQAKL